MICLRNVTKEYKLGEHTTLVPVRNISLEVSKGELVIIIGRSGTGKSTLLNLVSGLIHPTSGEVLIEDKQLDRMSDKEISHLRGQKIGFIFQFPSLLPSLTIIENVTMPGFFSSYFGRQTIHIQADKLLSDLNLSDKREAYPKHLSAGEQRRAVIARSLINKPEILLADEPTSDLDEQTEQEVMNLLRTVNSSGVTLLMVTHSLQLLHYAHRAFKMENGSLVLL